MVGSYFFKVISHVSATLGPNPCTVTVESEQEIVVISENELPCNLENKRISGTSITAT